jgi:hypothetical protein
MRNPRFPLFAIVAYLALVGVLALSSSRTVNAQDGLPPGKDVRVVNKDTEPVPVSLQSPNPIPVRDVDAVVLGPYQELQTTPSMTGVESIRTAQFDTVPAGKRLVIELVTARAHVSENQRPIVSLTTVQGGNSVEHTIAMTQESVVEGEEFVELLGTHAVRLYADPGSTPFVTLRRYGRFFPGDAEGAFCKMSISGYLVPL